MAELNRVAICQRIAQAREQSGLTQVELGDLLHVHWRSIQNWESQKKPMVPWDRLGEIGEATGVTKEWLLHGDVATPTDDLARVRELLEAQEKTLAELLEKVGRLRQGSDESV